MADIYLDACCFIYLVEGQPEWRSVVEKRIRDLDPASGLVTSQLARLECRAKPMRDGDHALLGRYESLFGASRVAVLDVSAKVIDRATELPTALESGANEFWTGDAALSRCTDVAVTVLLPEAP